MKTIVITLLTISSIFCSYNAHSQFIDDDKSELDLLTIGGGAGFITFFGDLSNDNGLSNYTNIKLGYNFFLERRFGKIFCAQIDGIYGKVSYSEIRVGSNLNRNFESPLLNINAKAIFHFDNDYVIRRKSTFSPYIGFGVGYTTFDPHGDLKDANNDEYHYWEDGSIKDLAENDINAASASVIGRDYTFETQLKDSNETYARGTLTFPLTFGLKWKFTSRLQGRLEATYNITQTDWMDNVSENNDNDKFLYTGLKLSYVMRKKNPDKELYEDVDFKALSNGDTDGDGVKDVDDICQGTPAGVDVSEDGCPKDDDGDGVPNYIDKELTTAAGVTVDEHGITLTDEMILAKNMAYQDSIVEERVQVFSEAPSQEALDRIEADIQAKNIDKAKNGDSSTSAATSGLPEELQPADLDSNGFITADEISNAIDSFFEGGSDLTVSQLHELIDYFFEQ